MSALTVWLWALGGYGWLAGDRVLRERRGEEQPVWISVTWLVAWPLVGLGAVLYGAWTLWSDR